MTGMPQGFAIGSRAPILPYDCIVDGAASLAVPDDRGFTLIGDPDPGDVTRSDLCLRHDGPDCCDHGCPYFLRVMLNLARRRIDLTQFFLRGGERPQRRVERDGPRRGRSL